jgi:TRAP-type C4-dicarboxylate transport system permease small subunit
MINALHRIRKFVVSTAVIANMLGTGVLFVLVVIMNSDVVARGIFHAPIRGVTEIVIFSLVLIVFLQLPDVVNNDKLTRSDGLLSVLRVKKPAFADKLTRLIDAVAGIFMAMIAWTIWPEFLDSFETCQFFRPMDSGGSDANLLYQQPLSPICLVPVCCLFLWRL